MAENRAPAAAAASAFDSDVAAVSPRHRNGPENDTHPRSARIRRARLCGESTRGFDTARFVQPFAALAQSAPRSWWRSPERLRVPNRCTVFVAGPDQSGRIGCGVCLDRAFAPSIVGGYCTTHRQRDGLHRHRSAHGEATGCSAGQPRRGRDAERAVPPRAACDGGREARRRAPAHVEHPAGRNAGCAGADWRRWGVWETPSGRYVGGGGGGGRAEQQNPRNNNGLREHPAWWSVAPTGSFDSR